MWPFKKKIPKKYIKTYCFGAGPDEGTVRVFRDTDERITRGYNIPVGKEGTGKRFLTYLAKKDTKWDMDGTMSDLIYEVIKEVDENYDPSSEYKKNPNQRPKSLFV